MCAAALMYYLKQLKGIKLAKRSFYQKLFIAALGMVFVIEAASLLLGGVIHFGSGRTASVIYSGILIALGAFSFITIVAKLRLLSVREWFIIPFGRRMAMYQLWLNQKK